MSKIFKDRYLASRLPKSSRRCLVLLTGARQTGKTTLARALWPELPYFNLDAIETRENLLQIHTLNWGKQVGDAILDEAQKLPLVFEKVKYAYDADQIDFTALTGSSQILLIQKIRESLAGRVFIYELFPLMLGEILGQGRGRPLLGKLLANPGSIDKTLSEEPSILLADAEAGVKEAFQYMLQWGGMPALLELSEKERLEWLKSYRQTYLERDLGDLVRFNDLMPFNKLQKLAALRTGEILSFSSLARDSGISPATSRNYLRYLEISYQAFLLQPYYRNLTSSVRKAPKLYWTDIGIWRALTGMFTSVPGPLFETYVVSEVLKWIRTSGANFEPYYYRTRSGMEVDLLLVQGEDIIGIEIKNRDHVVRADTKALRRISEAVGKKWIGGLVVTNGGAIRELEHSIWQVPAERLFS